MDLYDQAWKNIIRPTQIKSRQNCYGPKEQFVENCKIVRKDVTAQNRNNKQIAGFVFYSPDFEAEETVLYIHGNGGSKLESLPLVELIPKFKMNFAAFDLLGCGNSDPQNLTYGLNEVFDIRDMLQEIRKHTKVNRVILWGRSMGSLCSIMFADMYSYEINGLILDSPFKSLQNVIERIALRRVSLPSIILKPFLYMIKQRAIKQINYDIFSIDYLNIFKKLNTNIPILFVFSNFDTIVPAQQVLEFYNVYKGPKDLCQIYRTHDQDRPEDLFKQGMMWITRTKKKNIEGMLQARELLYENKKLKDNQNRCC